MISLWSLFGSVAASNFIARIFLSLGVSFVTFQGLDSILSLASEHIKGLFGDLPIAAAALLGLADIDFAINLVFSAYAARLAMFAGRQMRLIK